MKSISLALCSFVAVIAATAPAHAQTVIDFDTPLASSGATYSESGVTFSTVSSGTLQFTNGPNGTINLLPESQSGPRPEVRADFLSALTGTVSVDLGDFNADADLLFLELFDMSNASLGFTSLAISSSDATMHTLTLSAPNIAFAVFGARSPSLNGSSIFADNFTFSSRNTGAVPEPATWAMMLIGFGGMGVALRRRRRPQNLLVAA